MLKLPESIVGQKFTSSNGIEYTCIGFGIGDAGTSAFLVGAFYDALKDDTTLKTILLKDVSFKKDLTNLK